MARPIGRFRMADVVGSVVIDGVDVTEGIDLVGDLSDAKDGSRYSGQLWYWE